LKRAGNFDPLFKKIIIFRKGKSMNKMLVLVCLFILHISISAQYYISVSGGYALPAGEGILFAKPMDFSAYDRVHGSYGQGWKLNAAFGRTLTEALAIELEGGYSYGKSISVENATLTLNYFEIAALATIRAQRNGFAPYIKLGPVWRFRNLLKQWRRVRGQMVEPN
jgi:hypothetical protein